MRVVAVLAVFLSAGSACPQGLSTYYGGYCMRWDDWYNIYENGFKSCTKDNTHPPVIRSQSDTDAFLEAAKKFGKGNDLLIGLKCNSNSKQMEWIDGTPLTWTNFKNSDDYKCKNSKYFLMNHKTGKWEEHTSGLLNTADLFCQYSNPNQDPNCFQDFLPAANPNGQTRYCYKVNKEPANYFTLESTGFKQYFGHAAIIHDSQFNDYLRRTAIANGLSNGFFIGLRRANSQGVYSWPDGSAANYTNFAQSGNTGTGDCVIMDTLSSTGSWKNADCSQALPTIYTQNAKPYVVATPLQCSSGQLLGTGSFSSPGFPLQANVACTYTVIPNVGQRVELTIDYLEANACCDSLSVTVDGKITTLTGANQNYVYTGSAGNPIKVSWSPGNSNGVKGFHATFRSIF